MDTNNINITEALLFCKGIFLIVLLCPHYEKEIFDALQKLPYIRDILFQGKNFLAKILISI